MVVRYRHTGSEMLYTAQTTGGGVVDISNNGISIITSTAAERYVLASPIAGCRKTLLFLASTSSLDRVVELSSVSSSDAVTVVVGTGIATGTEITCNATVAFTVELVGLSTSQWHLLYSKGAVADSTAVVFGAS